MAVAAVAMAGSGGGAGASAAPGPIKTHVHSLPLTGASASLKALGARSTAPFSMVGVTWNGARTKLRGAVEVRTRSANSGHWTQWLKMQQPDDIPDPAELNRPGVRGGMSPMWSGPSNGIQVRAAGAHNATALPAGLRVDLIDPGKATTGTSGQTGSGMGLAGYAMDATATDTATPTDSATATDTATASGSAGAPDTPTATDSASPTATTTATASASASPSTAASASASPSASASSWPSQLPTLAQAYPSCPTSSASPSASASQTRRTRCRPPPPRRWHRRRWSPGPDGARTSAPGNPATRCTDRR
ncbi:hypothetical protein ACFQ0G_26835 [Streptomyces chiangmaiensis]